MRFISTSGAAQLLENGPMRVFWDPLPLPVVMLSLADYQALEETAYLLYSPKNARRLMESILELESGRGTEQGLIE